MDPSKHLNHKPSSDADDFTIISLRACWLWLWIMMRLVFLFDVYLGKKIFLRINIHYDRPIPFPPNSTKWTLKRFFFVNSSKAHMIMFSLRRKILKSCSMFSIRPIDLHSYTSSSENGAMNINFGRRLIAYPNNAIHCPISSSP